MFKKPSRTLRLLPFLLVVAVFLGACSRASTPSQSQAESQTTPGGKDSLTLGITQEPGLFNPHKAQAAGDKEILFNIYEGLMKANSEGGFSPALAESYEIAPDALSYVFNLRPEVYFHNGQPLTAEDVVYSLSQVAGLNDGIPLISDLAVVQSVKATGENQVTVTLKTPDSGLLPFFSSAIIPKNSGEEKHPSGTGPFKFSSYTVGQNVVLEKNNQYWQKDLPYLDEVVFKITADMDSGFLELQAGSIDIFPYLTNDKARQLTQTYNIMSGDTNMVQIFALNNKVAPFDKPLVREAFNYAVDREMLIEQTMEGFGTRLFTGMTPVMGEFFNSSLSGAYQYNPEKAKALLTEAGYPEGISTTITVPSNYLIHVNTAIVLADQLKASGITLEIKQVDWNTWLKEVYVDRNYETTVIALTSNFPPRDVMSRYVSTSSDNFINFNSAEFDSMYAALLATTEASEQIGLYHRMQEILVEDNASVFLQDPSNIVAVKKGIGGYKIFPFYLQDLSSVYFEKTTP